MDITKITNPLVSIIIICFNGAETLAEAIDSALGQTWSNKEIIVVDDGSTDNSVSIARQYGEKIRVITKPNGGIASARNAGFNAAKGEFISWLDSDDRFAPDKTELQMELLIKRPELVAVASDFLAFNESGLLSTSFIDEYYSAFCELSQSFVSREAGLSDHSKVYMGDFSSHILSGNFLHPGTLLIRRTAYEAAGLQDETMGSAADFEFIIRLTRQGPCAIIMRALLEYRISPNQDSGAQNMERNLKYVVRCMEAIYSNKSRLEKDSQKRVKQHLHSLYSDLSREVVHSSRKEALQLWLKALSLGKMNKTLLITMVKMATPEILLNLKRRLF